MGKTFLSLFSQFEKGELCQLYIYPSLPNVDRCSSYYRVTDKDVLSSLLSRKKPGGEVDPALISEDQGLYEKAEDQALYKNRKNKSALRRLLRDAMWSLSHWNNGNLAEWLEREKPDRMFVAPGAAKFLYDLALEISQKLRIPVVTYICDEYYFVKTPASLLDRLRLKLLRGKIEKLMAASAHLVVISEELKAAYGEKFRIETTTLMTGTDTPVSRAAGEDPDPVNICYFGNIRCNRFRSLGDVGRALDQINQEHDRDYRLKIYTAEKDPRILDTFGDIRCAELCGFVSGDAFDEALHDAHLLLHVEAFDDESIDFTKHSISTKIADSLASGIPLFAYGPGEISSMRHLLRHRCAITATSKDALKGMLEAALTAPDLRKRTVENALAAADAFHNSEKTGLRLRQILRTVTGAGGELP